MTDKIMFDPILLNKLIAKRPSIWQMKFLDMSKLSRFITNRGLGFTHTHIKQLWQLRILRADLIRSVDNMQLEGINEAGKDEMGYYLYTDDRKLEQRTEGWCNALYKIDQNQQDFTVLFHPFRYYILYHLRRVLSSVGHPMHILIPTDKYREIINDNISWFEKWSAKPNFIELISQWDSVTSLAIVTEPCIYGKIFKIIHFSATNNMNKQRRLIDNHWEDIIPIYKKLGITTIDDLRRKICTDAEILDPNKNIHTMIRLMKGDSRLNIKGKLGGAIYLLTMAEMIRLAAERIIDIKLREEDELGFGVMPKGLKKMLYGSDRVLNGDQQVAKNFISQFGLNYGVKIRFYLEGDTEFGAIECILGEYNTFELINLSGEFIEKRGKGLKFKGNLKNDLKSGIFSVILLDGDKPDNIRVVRNAARNDEICGIFFVSDPDFEFGNFTLDELEEVICRMTEGENGKANVSREELHKQIKLAKSGREFFRFVQSVPEFRQCSRNKDWGKMLIEYAYQDENTNTRPIVDFIEKVVRLAGCEYHYFRKNYKVNPDTGELEKRPA